MECKKMCLSPSKGLLSILRRGGELRVHNSGLFSAKVELWKTKIPLGEKVKVYKNLHQKCYSVKSLKTGRVIAYCSEIILTNPTFSVSEAGRIRVLSSGQKNVHAFVIGNFVSHEANLIGHIVPVTYNPYRFSSFVRKLDKSSIKKASIARLDKFGITVVE